MILLASESPQRRELLQAAGLPHVCVPSACDEEAIVESAPETTAIERARAKALHADWSAHRAALASGEAVVLGVDTVVALDRQLIGKPADREEAKAILGRLAGTTHMIVTAHACLRPGLDDLEQREAVALALARITLRPMSPTEIEAYVASGEADGKAGAYAFQGSADRFVDDLQGDRDTVIGLHIPTVHKLYREITGHDPA